MSPAPQLRLQPWYERRASVQSTRILPSPSLVAARAYNLQQTVPIGRQGNAFRWRRSLIDTQLTPRRHSALARPENLAQHVAKLDVTTSAYVVHLDADEGDNASPTVKPETQKQKTTRPSTQVEAIRDDLIDSSQKPEPSSARPVMTIRPVSFQFTHDHLRDWGYAYLGNFITADALVNAVTLRRPSLDSLKDLPWQEDTPVVTIRARIAPRSKDRQPFLIYKEFNIEQLRASMPVLRSERRSPSFILRRSSRSRRPSLQLLSSQAIVRSGTAQALRRNQNVNSLQSIGREAVPIRKCSIS